MAEDRYFTVANAGEGQYREKMSRFLAFALHTETPDDARNIIKEYQNRYHDARHVCWAYALGPDASVWQLNDNGEPSGTAGKPILGQIRSHEVTDVVVVVVRYFGGIKLGTSGLIAAYRQAAALALDDAGKRECFSMTRFRIDFPYAAADSVIKLTKGDEFSVVERHFDNLCAIVVDVRLSAVDKFRGLVSKLEGVVIEPIS